MASVLVLRVESAHVHLKKKTLNPKLCQIINQSLQPKPTPL